MTSNENMGHVSPVISSLQLVDIDVRDDYYDAQVAQIRSNIVSASSHTGYRNSIVRFIMWLSDNKPNLVTPEIQRQISNRDEPEEARRQILLSHLCNCSSNNPPILLEELGARDFMRWMVTLRRDDGRYFAKTTYSGHRSALFYLFKIYDRAQTTVFQEELSRFFAGLKREIVQMASVSGTSLKEGKDPLPFDVLKELGREMIIRRDPDTTFGHLFLLLSWNLMCRASNTVRIYYQHIEWRNDALCIYFSHHKGDQSGDRPKDPRHIYANPLAPEVAFFNSL